MRAMPFLAWVLVLTSASVAISCLAYRRERRRWPGAGLITVLVGGYLVVYGGVAVALLT